MKRPFAVLVAVALCLVCLAPSAQADKNLDMPPAQAGNAPSESASSRAGGAENQQQPMEASAPAGNQRVQLSPDFVRQANVITCVVPGAQPRRIPVPEGGIPTGFCPASAIIVRSYNIDPRETYSAPKAPDGSPPPIVAPTTGRPP